MGIKKRKKAFTLIELLVVIAIIGLLLAIVIPSLRKAKSYAKKTICRSNLRQIGTAIGAYETDFTFNFRENEKWYFGNGTGDLPYEDQSHYAKDIMDNHMLPDRRVFFCPGVRNVSDEKNYRYNEAVAGNTQYYSVASTEELMRRDSSFTDRPAFWSTYAWLWKKDADNPNANYASTDISNASSGVLLTDVPNSFWALAMAIGNTDGTMLSNIFGNSSEGTIQTVPHGNALMKDLSVANPADKDEDLNMWLWGNPTWANN